MFRASLCPSSGEQDVCYCMWCAALVLLDVVGSGCGALPCRVWALWRLLFNSNIRLVLLKMGIMMPETCWEIVKNKHLTVASCWFSLSLHRSFNVAGNYIAILGPQENCQIFLPDLNQIWIFSTDFHESPKYKISRQFVEWEPRWYVQTERRTDQWTNGHDNAATGAFATMRTRPKIGWYRIYLAEVRNQWRLLMNKLINWCAPCKVYDFMAKQASLRSHEWFCHKQ